MLTGRSPVDGSKLIQNDSLTTFPSSRKSGPFLN